MEIYEERQKKLEEEVSKMIDDAEDVEVEPVALLGLVDIIQRLGLGYSFDKDIKSALLRITSVQEKSNDRKEMNLHATALSFRFLRQHGYQVSQEEIYEERQKKLEEEVRKMIDDAEDVEVEPVALLGLVDIIQRLGLGYSFDKDIKSALLRITSVQEKSNDRKEMNLHATALSFRLLRQHGYHVSQDVFNHMSRWWTWAGLCKAFLVEAK
ncbi:unnamed protein product [Camellia sinensis]